MADPCRLDPGMLVAYRDGTLPVGRREIVEAHLIACHHCQERLAIFDDVDRMIQTQAAPPAFPKLRREELHARLRKKASRQAGVRHYLLCLAPRSHPLARLIVALLVLLAILPAATQAGFPLGRFVHFAEVEITQVLPLEAQNPVRHVAPAAPSTTSPLFRTVVPADLPLGLMQVEQSRPNSERVETLYHSHDGVAILVAETPAETGQVTLDAITADLSIVRGTQVVYLRDPRPDAVSALFWERDGVFFDVMVIEAPSGTRGGLKQTDALLVVEALMEAQDAIPA